MRDAVARLRGEVAWLNMRRTEARMQEGCAVRRSLQNVHVFEV